MPVQVRIPGRTEAAVRTVAAAEDIDTDELGVLILTAGQGKDEVTVAVYAAGAWISAERA